MTDTAVYNPQENGIHKKFKINWKLVMRTLVFVGGLGTTFILLGFGTGLIGDYLNGQVFLIISGAVVIVLGLNQT